MSGVPSGPAAEPQRGSFAAPDGRRLAFDDTGGAGPAVLCLAGLSRNMADFDALTEVLSPRFRVVRLDSRGRGGSEHAADPLAEYTVPVESGDVLALLDHLGIGAVSIVGTSRGGILGMALGAGVRDRVRALVLNDVGAVIEMVGLDRILSSLGREPMAASFEAAAADLAEANAGHFVDVPPERWLVHARAIYRDENGRPQLSYDPKLRMAAMVAMDSEVATINLWPMFMALEGLPILLIRGELSDILSRGTAEEMRRQRPDMAYVEVGGRGHAPFLDEPQALAAIAAFLEEHA